MIQKMFWIIFVSYLFFEAEADENLFEMVLDVLKSFRQPFSVSAFFCNPFGEKSTFI